MTGEPTLTSGTRTRPTTCTVEASDGDSVVRVDGDLDLSTLTLLARALAEAAAATERVLVADLTQCRFLCSRSFAMLEAAADDLRARGAQLVVRGWPQSFALIRAVVGATSPLAAA